MGLKRGGERLWCGGLLWGLCAATGECCCCCVPNPYSRNQNAWHMLFEYARLRALAAAVAPVCMAVTGLPGRHAQHSSRSRSSMQRRRFLRRRSRCARGGVFARARARCCTAVPHPHTWISVPQPLPDGFFVLPSIPCANLVGEGGAQKELTACGPQHAAAASRPDLPRPHRRLRPREGPGAPHGTRLMHATHLVGSGGLGCPQDRRTGAKTLGVGGTLIAL